jgi:hypothetical protein
MVDSWTKSRAGRGRPPPENPKRPTWGGLEIMNSSAAYSNKFQGRRFEGPNRPAARRRPVPSESAPAPRALPRRRPRRASRRNRQGATQGAAPFAPPFAASTRTGRHASC